MVTYSDFTMKAGVETASTSVFPTRKMGSSFSRQSKGSSVIGAWRGCWAALRKRCGGFAGASAKLGLVEIIMPKKGNSTNREKAHGK